MSSCTPKTLIRRKINYIKYCLKNSSNVSIYTGKLSEKEKKSFEKYFKVTPELITGYTKFELKDNTNEQ